MTGTVYSALKRALTALQEQRRGTEQQIAAVMKAIDTLGSSATRARRGRATRQRTAMSAAQKRAVSKRMKAYWAKQRAAKSA